MARLREVHIRKPSSTEYYVPAELRLDRRSRMRENLRPIKRHEVAFPYDQL